MVQSSWVRRRRACHFRSVFCEAVEASGFLGRSIFPCRETRSEREDAVLRFMHMSLANHVPFLLTIVARAPRFVASQKGVSTASNSCGCPDDECPPSFGCFVPSVEKKTAREREESGGGARGAMRDGRTNGTSRARFGTRSVPRFRTSGFHAVGRGMPSRATFGRDLGLGSVGEEVCRLQADILGMEPTGNFDSETKKRLMAWQEKNRVEPTGYFGPLSRILVEEQLQILLEEARKVAEEGVVLNVDATQIEKEEDRAETSRTEGYSDYMRPPAPPGGEHGLPLLLGLLSMVTVAALSNREIWMREEVRMGTQNWNSDVGKRLRKLSNRPRKHFHFLRDGKIIPGHALAGRSEQIEPLSSTEENLPPTYGKRNPLVQDSYSITEDFLGERKHRKPSLGTPVSADLLEDWSTHHRREGAYNAVHAVKSRLEHTKSRMRDGDLSSYKASMEGKGSKRPASLWRQMSERQDRKQMNH